MSLPISLQLYSIRDELEADFRGALETIKKMGYDGVEFAGIEGHTPEEIKQICDEIGLVPMSAHVGYQEYVDDLEKVISDYSTIGCKYLVIAANSSRRFAPGKERYEEFIETVNRVGARAKKAGMTLLYHNHSREFAKYEGEYILDVYYGATAPDILQAEIDTCWVSVAEINPVEYVKKYTGRVPVLHLKDFYYDREAFVIDLDGDAHPLPKDMDYRPLGDGLEDIPALVKAAEEAKCEWIVVELDAPAKGTTALECAEKSIKYLRSIGY